MYLIVVVFFLNSDIRYYIVICNYIITYKQLNIDKSLIY